MLRLCVQIVPHLARTGWVCHAFLPGTMFPGVTSRSGDATASVHSPPSRKLRRVRSNPQISANPLPLAPSSGRGHPQGVISLGADWMNDHADVALPWALECAMTLIPSLRHSSEFSLENEVFKPFFCGQTVGKYVTFVAAVAVAGRISLRPLPCCII